MITVHKEGGGGGGTVILFDTCVGSGHFFVQIFELHNFLWGGGGSEILIFLGV